MRKSDRNKPFAMAHKDPDGNSFIQKHHWALLHPEPLDSYCLEADENHSLLYFGNSRRSRGWSWSLLSRFHKANVCLTHSVSLCCRRMPSLLEYLSYNCNFMGILAGPLCSYKDYITFIEGRSYHMMQSGENGKEEIQCERTEPSPNVRPGDSSAAFLACVD